MRNIIQDGDFYSDPHIQFLTQILNDIRRGALLVPRFQRPFVWRKDQQLDLLRSIRQGIPIGAIMVWRTERSNIKTYGSLGPYRLESNVARGTRDYLLDGVQRLSTLYGALNLPSEIEANPSDDDEGPYRTYFDLVERDFLFLFPSEVPKEHYLPLFILLDSIELLRFQRRLPEHADRDLLIAECDRLAGSFRQYKVPIIPIATDDLGLATLTFQRINSQGQKMSDYHMLHALTWSPEFDLMEELERLKIDVLGPLGWAEIDEDPILKSAKLALELDLYKGDVEEFSDKISSNQNVLVSTVNAVAKVATFMLEHLRIPAPEFVPYSLQIVLLADAMTVFENFDETQIALAVQWFWFTTYSEAFSGISDDRAKMAVADLRSTLFHRRPVWSNDRIKFSQLEKRPRYDFRAVRTKSFILNLARIMDFNSENAVGTKLISEYGRKAVNPIMPNVAFPRDNRSLAAALGNKVLADPMTLGELRKHFGNNAPGGLLPVDELSVYQPDIDRYLNNLSGPADFVEGRGEALFEIEAQFAHLTAGEFWENSIRS
jgi:hypothetical protein